jgi:hypothetical protein
MDAHMNICPDCGAQIPADSPAGLCIACVLTMAQKESEPASDLPARAPRASPRQVGDYELIREIGRGGMGVVYEARQQSLNRLVALKLILAGEFASETAVARFKEEAELIASLAHPNIVPIYEIGEDQGCHFYSMKLIDGQSLAQALGSSRRREADSLTRATGRPPPHVGGYNMRESATLLAKVARAVHFAHQRGIIHRDLSPENILLDAEGEPCITDFGLARLVDRDRRLTQTNAILGKPDYMAPEQVDPRGQHVTTASDIFSLGTILYHLITGELPFIAETPLATLALIRNSEPAPPSRLKPAVSRDLETICLKCLAKDPAGRYASAAALADDLERWLRHEPILARPVNALERSWKWIRRNPLKAALVGVGLLAVLGPLVVTFCLYHFVLPQQARAHPIIGRDQNIGGFALTFDTNRADRATMNFDLFVFKKRPRQACLYFTNVPPESFAWVSNLKCQIFADIPGAPDEPRSPVVRQGDTFVISQSRYRDRAYYVAPFGWQGQDVLARAPVARLCIIVIDGD